MLIPSKVAGGKAVGSQFATLALPFHQAQDRGPRRTAPILFYPVSGPRRATDGTSSPPAFEVNRAGPDGGRRRASGLGQRGELRGGAHARRIIP